MDFSRKQLFLANLSINKMLPGFTICFHEKRIKPFKKSLLFIHCVFFRENIMVGSGWKTFVLFFSCFNQTFRQHPTLINRVFTKNKFCSQSKWAIFFVKTNWLNRFFFDFAIKWMIFFYSCFNLILPCLHVWCSWWEPPGRYQ